MPRKQYTKAVRARAALELRRREFAEKCFKYRDNPVGYITDILGERPTDSQADALSRLVKNRRVAWMAAHAVGKSCAANWASNWWYDCFEKSITYITAPTWEQALNLTFKQVRNQRRRGCKEWRSEMPGRILESGYVLDEDKIKKDFHYIKAVNAEKGEGIQGEHSAPILIILEEATGVPPYIWEAVDGLMTHPDCRLLAIGNPTDEATNFGLACKPNSGYSVTSVSVFDHPNIELELEAKPPVIPEAVRLAWLRDNLQVNTEPSDSNDPDAFEFWSVPSVDAALFGLSVKKNKDAVKWYYKPNAVFEGRVMGRFPGQVLDHIIPPRWLDDLPKIDPPVGELPEIGIDSARAGDDRTVIAIRHGPCALRAIILRQIDQDYVLRHVREAIQWAAKEEGRNYDPKSIPLKFDVTGGLGTGPADTLKNEGFNVWAVNSAESAQDEDQYPNMRSELWFTMREMARTKNLDLSRLPADISNKLRIELSTPKWTPDNTGRKVVERKKDIKKRLKESPDLADAFNLSYANKTSASKLEASYVSGIYGRWGALSP